MVVVANSRGITSSSPPLHMTTQKRSPARVSRCEPASPAHSRRLAVKFDEMLPRSFHDFIVQTSLSWRRPSRAALLSRTTHHPYSHLSRLSSVSSPPGTVGLPRKTRSGMPRSSEFSCTAQGDSTDTPCSKRRDSPVKSLLLVAVRHAINLRHHATKSSLPLHLFASPET